MPQPIQDIIECLNQGSFGGLKNLQGVPSVGVDYFPLDFEIGGELLVEEPIILFPDYQWINIGTIPYTLDLKQRQLETKQGKNHPFTLTGEIPALDDSLGTANSKTLRRRLFDRMARYRWIFRINDFEGKNILIGSKENPCQFSADENIEKKVQDGHIYDFSITGVELYRFFEYSV